MPFDVPWGVSQQTAQPQSRCLPRLSSIPFPGAALLYPVSVTSVKLQIAYGEARGLDLLPPHCSEGHSVAWQSELSLSNPFTL